LDYDGVINCIAYTDTYDENREKHWNINYKAVADLVDVCNGYEKKLIHISTDYLYTHSKENASEEDVPVHCRNWYGYTKLLADGYIQLKSNDFLLLRGTHKKEPFTHDKAWKNQKGNFDYVSTISKLYIKLIEGDVNGIYNVGTKIKTMYDLAKQTKVDVEAVNGWKESMPVDVTMNIKKLDLYS
jgi:dTDP-4-dehydrorhamnose reductase